MTTKAPVKRPTQYALCEICSRAPRGFAWRLPTSTYSASFLSERFIVRAHPRVYRFCSMRCSDLFLIALQKNRMPFMNDVTDYEQQAAQDTIVPLADYVISIGADTPLNDYSKAQIEQLISVVLTHYHTRLQQLVSQEVLSDAS